MWRYSQKTHRLHHHRQGKRIGTNNDFKQDSKVHFTAVRYNISRINNRMENQNMKNTETNTNYDVAVCGGGIAGISAALAAAREGKKVILFEKQYMLGGLGTAGLVTIYLPLCDGYGHQVSFGIAEELLKLSVTYGAEAR